MSALEVLFIDNFDSFSFNLVDELKKRGATVRVHRNDLPLGRALELAQALAPPRLVVISPGPGAPRDAGCIVPLCAALAARGGVPLFGVCLGHQAIVEACGGRVGFAGEVVHGKTSAIVHDGSGPFDGLPTPMPVARYHSLAALELGPDLRAVAHAGELVMAVLHRRAPIFGVQFHPESILTPQGGLLMAAVMRWAAT
jgi:anthranilate synthase/aminodeoxychorismate synthase-like glutamine amidotransferase